jgi:hypothetical protein
LASSALTQTPVGLDPPCRTLALFLSQLAPVSDLDKVVGLHNIVDVLVRVDLKNEEKNRV